MTLNEWCDKNKIVAMTHPNGAKYVPEQDYGPLRTELWHLDDYHVSSVVAGTVWLVKKHPPIVVTLKDATWGNPEAQLAFHIEINADSIEIRPEGFGTKGMMDGTSGPIFIELRDGVPVVAVWSDINEEDATHLISLDGAAESNRQEE